jgi:hypothetical protein
MRFDAVARHLVGGDLTLEGGFNIRVDDVASKAWQSLGGGGDAVYAGVARRGGARGGGAWWTLVDYTLVCECV